VLIWGAEIYRAHKGKECQRFGFLKSVGRERLVPPAPAHMDRNPFLHAQRILAGTAEVDGGFVHSAGGGGKESVLSVVEVLDEVRNVFPAFCPALKQNRH
jgi:hypothetical protein